MGDDHFCIAYTVLLRHYLPLIGNEAFSFISYALRDVDGPLERFRGISIAEELYLSPVPPGRLPLDMPIPQFVETA